MTTGPRRPAEPHPSNPNAFQKSSPTRVEYDNRQTIEPGLFLRYEFVMARTRDQ
jgi:hypothetical protein